MKQLLDQFVCVRVLGMNEVDLSIFDFDYDQTWWCMFADADGRVYSRFGGRDDADPFGRVSLDGLKHTMRQVLDAHQSGSFQPSPPIRKPITASQLLGGKAGCIHCHHVGEGLVKSAKKTQKSLDPEKWYYLYPLPENVGLKLEIDAGNRVGQVAAKSSADKAGLRTGDVIRRIDAVPTLSQGDVMYALNQAPAEGKATVQYLRGNQILTVSLDLPLGWRHIDFSWRKSLHKEKAIPDRKPSPAGGDWKALRSEATPGPSPNSDSAGPSNAEAAPRAGSIPFWIYPVAGAVLLVGIYLTLRLVRQK